MTHANRRLPDALRTAAAAIAIAAMSLALAACGSAVSTASPSASAPASAASTAPTAAPSVAPSTAAASPGAVASPSAPSGSPAACAKLPLDFAPPSDRFTDIQIVANADSDVVTFVFGDPSVPGPAAPPKATVKVARPPYTQAGSGAKIDMVGAHVVQLVLNGMSLQNDVGQPQYAGATELTPHLPALQKAALYDASEGVIGWYLGYDGGGCVSVEHDAKTVTVTIHHS